MKVTLIVVGVLLFGLLVFGAKYVSVRNDLVTQQEAVKAQWAQVESAMQRRADLIPNLVATVKGFASHETEVYKDIADARAAHGRCPYILPSRAKQNLLRRHQVRNEVGAPLPWRFPPVPIAL